MPKLIEDTTPGRVLERNWTAYYQAVVDRPPRETLLRTLDLCDRSALSLQDNPNSPTSAPLYAVDLGCGDGRDTVELLRRGWRVLAIDGEEEAIARLKSRPNLDLELLSTQVISFAELTLPEAVDLINASFCLPFCTPAEFPNLWQKIVAALRSGGRFSGQLFGDRDSWAQYSNMTHHSRRQVEELLGSFEVEFWQEEDHPGKTALGEEKNWHIFQIVARKKD